MTVAFFPSHKQDSISSAEKKKVVCVEC